MRTLIVAALLAAGPATSATYENDPMVARRGGDSVRLWDAPCTHPGTLALIKAFSPSTIQHAKKSCPPTEALRVLRGWRQEPHSTVRIQGG